MKLNRNFYLDPDVVLLSKKLIGKVLCTTIDGQFTSGLISETEAYAGIGDKASHVYGNRRTKRTETMYAEGGTAYVYLCYGIHSLFNVVTNIKDTPHAVLIRGIIPIDGIEIICQRKKIEKLSYKTTIGPGNVSTALGIHFSTSGLSLLGDKIWIEDRGFNISPYEIQSGPRIGVAYAAEDALLPYRFWIDPKQLFDNIRNTSGR